MKRLARLFTLFARHLRRDLPAATVRLRSPGITTMRLK